MDVQDMNQMIYEIEQEKKEPADVARAWIDTHPEEVKKMLGEALGYRVVDTVKATGLFGVKEALRDENALAQARYAGKRLAKTVKLRKEVAEKLKSLVLL